MELELYGMATALATLSLLVHYYLCRLAETGYFLYMLAAAGAVAFAVFGYSLGAAAPAYASAAVALGDLGVLAAGFLSYMAAVQLRQAFARAGDALER